MAYRSTSVTVPGVKCHLGSVLRTAAYQILFTLLASFIGKEIFAETTLPVSVAPVVEISIAEEIKLTGSLLAKRTSLLSSEVAGIVKAIHVDDGSRVDVNQAIVELDTDIAIINKNTAAAALAEADAALVESKRRHAELSELKTQSHASKTSVAAAGAQIALNAAARARVASELRRANTLLDKHAIAAPFSGLINRKLVEVGQWVDTNTPLVELVDTSLLRLEIPVPQYYFSAVKENTPVQIRFDALPEKVIESTVSSIIPISSNTSRTFRIRVDIANQDRSLAPGMTAKTTLRLGSTEQAKSLLAPRDALIRKPDNTRSIWVVEEIDGIKKVVEMPVSIGRNYRGGVEILSSNIAPGTKVVVRGNEILRAGQTVRIANEIGADY